MPPLKLNLDQIGAARTRLAGQREAERVASAEYHRERAKLDAMRRSGANPRAIQQAAAQVARRAERVKAAATAARTSLRSIATLSDRLIRGRDPALMVQSLATTHPVALLPVAVQTRYDDATTKLMIRIYPDAVHGFAHQEGLLPSEVVEGKMYWTARFAVPADAVSPWTQIARALGPSRGAYVVQATTPTNVAEISTAQTPQFDEAAIPVAAAESRQVFAQALPDRFVAIGFRAGQRIFRKWGSVVSDQLAISPLFDPLLMEDEQNTDPFAGDRAWMVDYAKAEAAGMAITVTQADLQNAQLGQGVERLIVLGVDWTQTPQSAAELVGSLLDNHLHSDGLAFVAQGTPTNNTAAKPQTNQRRLLEARASPRASSRDMPLCTLPPAARWAPPPRPLAGLFDRAMRKPQADDDTSSRQTGTRCRSPTTGAPALHHRFRQRPSTCLTWWVE